MTDDQLNAGPRSASAQRRWLAHARLELVLLARNGEQMLLMAIIPLALLIAGSKADAFLDIDASRPIDIVAPGVLALAIISSSFTSLAIATGFERRYGVLKRLAATPLGPGGLLVGKATAVFVAQCVQLLVLAAVAFALGWQPHGGMATVGWFVLVWVLGTATFVAGGLLLAGFFKAEITLALANLLFGVFVALGAVLVPLANHPDAAEAVLRFVPSAALGESMRDIFAGGPPPLWALPVLLVWAIIVVAMTRRSFRWE